MGPRTFDKRTPIAVAISITFAAACGAVALTEPGTLVPVLLLFANLGVSLGTLAWATSGE